MLTLRPRQSASIPLDLLGFLPEKVRSLNLLEIAKWQVLQGNRHDYLAEWFDVSGDPSDQIIEFSGDCSHVKHLGEGMTTGKIYLDGSAGMHLGSQMAGGEIEISGNVGNWCGAEMRGGFIRVRGNTGDNLGAAYRGSPIGMRGGTILVQGNAGDEVGSNMRRGWICIGGTCGDFAGCSMIAGSIFAFRGIGQRTGAGMKRGTIAVFSGGVALPPTFTYDCEYSATFITLYLKQLESWKFPLSDSLASLPFRRFRGDHLTLGKGEVLCR